MLYGRKQYDEDIEAIDACEMALSAARIGTPDYGLRLAKHLVVLGSIADYFEGTSFGEQIAAPLVTILNSQAIDGQTVLRYQATFNWLRRKLKGKLLNTVSLLAESDLHKKDKAAQHLKAFRESGEAE